MDKLKFLLDRFGDDSADADNAADTQEPQDTQDGAHIDHDGAQDDKPKGKKDKTPFAVFPDEHSFMARVQREARKQLKALLKELGVGNEDELKSIVSSHKELQERSKSELERLQETTAKLQKERDEYQSIAERVLKEAEVKVQAVALGVKPERIPYLLRLIDMNEIEVDEGKVDADTVKKAINKVLKDMPELKATVGTPKAGDDFSRRSGDTTRLSWEAIRSMSTAEVQKRLPEILEFMEKNPLR